MTYGEHWQDQWNRILRWRDRLEQSQTGPRADWLGTEGYRDELYALFQAIWHLRDWLANDPDVPGVDRARDLDRIIFDPDAPLRSLQAAHDLANGSKHRGVVRPAVDAAQIRNDATVHVGVGQQHVFYILIAGTREESTRRAKPPHRTRKGPAAMPQRGPSHARLLATVSSRRAAPVSERAGCQPRLQRPARRCVRSALISLRPGASPPWRRGVSLTSWRARMATLTEVNEALFVSGLWAAYGTVAEALRRPGAARALAQENWGQSRGRIARQDGITESADRDKELEWRAANPDVLHVDAAFGYVLDKPWPQEWAVTAPELSMLLGEMPSSAALRIKLGKRLDTLLAVADRAGYEDEVLWQAVDDLRALIARLGG